MRCTAYNNKAQLCSSEIWQGFKLANLVGTLFIDIGNMYCFGTGLLISMPEDIDTCINVAILTNDPDF